MKKTILSILCLLMSLCNYAYDFEVDGFYYNIISLQDLTVQLTCSGPSSVHDEMGYDNKFDYNHTYSATYSGDVVVPKTVEYAGRTFTVTSIHTAAFINCVIGTLTIPETVEEVAMEGIGGSFMCLMGTFRNLIVKDSEKPIKCGNFIIGSSSRTYFAFENWTKEELEEFAKNIPDHWEQVDITFYWIYNGGVINSVYLGRQIEGNGIVHGTSYYKMIKFGENIKSVSCADNIRLTSVTLPSSVKSLNFSGCTALKSIDAPGVETIGKGFSGCTRLESVNLPNLRVIYGDAFNNCTSLKSIDLPQGLVVMRGEYVFSNIENVVIPGTVSQIGKHSYDYDGNIYYDEYDNRVFADCSSLKTITMCNPVPIKLAESNFAAMTYLTATLKVPVGAAEAYRNADVWKNFFNIEEDASITDDVFTIYKEKNDLQLDYGSVEIDVEEALPAHYYNGVNYKFAKKGEPVTIKFVPDTGHKLNKVTISGIDVSEEVDDNVYQTTVVGGMAINAEFAYYDLRTVTIPEVGYTAYVTEFDAEIPSTTIDKAYKITEATTSGVILEPIETAKKGTAVILQGKEGYTSRINIYETGIAEKHTDNLFKAGGEMVGDGKTIYALGNKNGVVGFYLVKEGVTVPADKGYLVIDPSLQPNGVKEFIPFGGEATGLETIEEKSSDKENVIYNLAGQRVTQPTKSGIYIVNGKKVFINK